MNKQIHDFAIDNFDSVVSTLKDLCLIPAPSHLEDKRAKYCKDWFDKNIGEGAYIDDAKNVIFPWNCENSNEITVFVAHTDTVFPDLEPMPYIDDGEKIKCPGVGDDTASVSVLLHTVKYFKENHLVPKKGFLFVCNSCEEGLGDLKGTKQLFKDFEGRIARFISFDGTLDHAYDNCAGSHRYEVEVTTEGGHSFSNFGKTSAINELAKIIAKIYEIDVWKKEGEKTTFNVGTIEGGTSVNTIAQSAKMLCEYRSTHRDGLAYMQSQFERIFKECEREDTQIHIKMVGNRPCSNIDDAKIQPLRDMVSPLISEICGFPLGFRSASTDCNVPLSLGIPSICVGVYSGSSAHTREEWLYKDSLKPGLEFAIRFAIKLMED